MPDQSQPRRPARALLAAALVAVVLVLMRSFPTMWYEGYHFDSDQAVVEGSVIDAQNSRSIPRANVMLLRPKDRREASQRALTAMVTLSSLEWSQAYTGS